MTVRDLPPRLLSDWTMFRPIFARLRSHSTVVLAADGSILRAFAAAGGAWRFPADIGTIDPKPIAYSRRMKIAAISGIRA